MKILIYTHYFLPVTGGVQTSLRILAAGLAQISPSHSEHSRFPAQVTLVTQTAAEAMDDSGFPFRILRCPTLRQLFKLIKETDVVHLAGPCFLPLLLAQILRKSIVIEHHGYHACCPNGLLFYGPTQSQCDGYFLAGKYDKCMQCGSNSLGRIQSLRAIFWTIPRRWLCQKAACNITITDHVAKRVLLPHSRTIYYGIEESPLRPPSDRSRSPALHFAFLGRLVAEKGLPVLIQASRLLKDQGCSFWLSLIGDGPERKHLESEVDSCGLGNVTTFTGTLTGARLEAVLRDVDVIVMPSVCEETAGLSAIEQMMRGGAVIVSNIGGLSEVVGGAGLKFTPGNATDLAQCMRKMIENPSLRAGLGLAARERALQLFRSQSMIEAHASLYEEVARS